MAKKQKSTWPFRAFCLSFFVFVVLFLPNNALSASVDFSQFQVDNPPTPTVTPTVTPTPSSQSAITSAYEDEFIDAYLQLPLSTVFEPYVILNAVEFGSNSGNLIIKGGFRDKTFVCETLPCKVPFWQNDNIAFSAYSSSGLISERVLASVTVNETDDGYLMGIGSINKYSNLNDSCRALWDVPFQYAPPLWAEFPQFYYQLNTEKTLHYLARNLIINGIVDVSACANGGISQDFSWPTGCGLEKAREAMIEWQNQYDIEIWTVSKEIGVPPKILKTLIQVESQFWPANQRFYVDEYGLGQITQLGLDILLRDDYRLFQSVCAEVLDYCNTAYAYLPKEQQALIRGALLNSLDASCPYCEAGFDFAKAKQSVIYVGRILKSNCNAVSNILNGFDTFDSAEYEDYWKFTLFTYHSGITCFYRAADLTLENGQEMTWDNFAENTSCIDGQTYVDGFWGDLVSFDRNRSQPAEFGVSSLADAVFNEPPTPTPFPTQVLSFADVDVDVWIEFADGSKEPLNGIPVLVSLSDGKEITQTALNGFVSFDMQGYSTGSIVTISLPGLYQSQRFILPSAGTKKISFVFASPVLPFSFP